MERRVSLLIIDDEMQTRMGLQKYIHWKEAGVDQLFLAEGYEQAMKIMAEEKIHIVLSDIRMPHMNGIELCEELRKWNPSVKIIFLSGYADKEYLKGAIHLSAIEYFEKPVDISALEQCIKRTAEICREEMESSVRQQRTEELIHTSIPILQEQFITALLRGKFDRDLYEKIFADVRFPMNEENYYGCIILRYSLNRIPEGFDIGREQEKLQKLFSAYPVLMCRKRNYIIILLSLHEKTVWEKEVDWILYRYLHDSQKSRKYIFMSKSDLRRGSRELADEYEQTLVCMQKYYFYGIKNNEETGKEKKEQVHAKLEKLQYNFCEAISARDQTVVLKLAENIFRTCQEDPSEIPDVIRNRFFQLNYYIYQDQKRNQLLLEQDSDKNGQEFLWNRISGLETLEECYACLCESVKQFFDSLNNLETDNKTILQAVSYIKHNFTNENLSVKEIADNVQLSPTYLSSLFREKTGKTPGQYIRQVRMEHARLLLEDRQKTMAEIAKKCGFSDAKYFTKVFKSEFHISPSEYREKVVQTGEHQV